jgi:hypothetical protein
MEWSYLGGLAIKILGFLKAPKISWIWNCGKFRPRMGVLPSAKIGFKGEKRMLI